jgi:oligoribonuclease NrnB/cAMP/cGMP phosphodiesterase (DHH superfamily)
MTIKCFFHSADLDGHCSGAVVKYKYPDTELIPINYGYKFPWDKINKDDIVFVVDFHIDPVENMYKLYDLLKENFIWIDHHITAINDIKNNYPELETKIKGLRVNGTAACILTWKYLFPNELLPSAINLLGRYDVWDIDEPVLNFQYGMRINDTWPITQSSFWTKIIENHYDIVQKTINNGTIIRPYEERQYEIYVKSQAFEITIEGLKAIVVNRRLISSIFFKSIWDHSKYDLMISFGIKKNCTWDMSFYTDKPNIDVSKIAQKYGGGGHVQAAGVNGLKELPSEFLEGIKKLQEAL